MSTLAFETRHAGLDDAFGVAAVHDAAWWSTYSGLIPHQALNTMIRRRNPQWWARAIKHSTRILVLEAHGEVVGYATLGPNRVNTLPQDGEVYELYLMPQYQGVGLGKKLFLAARQELFDIGYSSIVVWVLEENEPAMRFYQNAGGVDIAEGTETFNGKTLNKVAFAWA